MIWKRIHEEKKRKTKTSRITGNDGKRRRKIHGSELEGRTKKKPNPTSFTPTRQSTSTRWKHTHTHTRTYTYQNDGTQKCSKQGSEDREEERNPKKKSEFGRRDRRRKEPPTPS